MSLDGSICMVLFVLIWVACVGFGLRLQTYMVLALCLFCGCGVVGCVRLFILFAWLDVLGVVAV